MEATYGYIIKNQNVLYVNIAMRLNQLKNRPMIFKFRTNKPTIEEALEKLTQAGQLIELKDHLINAQNKYIEMLEEKVEVLLKSLNIEINGDDEDDDCECKELPEWFKCAMDGDIKNLDNLRIGAQDFNLEGTDLTPEDISEHIQKSMQKLIEKHKK